MNIWKTIVGLIVTSVLSASVWAQDKGNSCEEQLNAATAEYDAGRFYGIPAMLKPCIDKGFSSEQRQRAFLLLTQTYILLNDPLAADNSYLEVLRANPEFMADTARDQIDVVYLSKRFTARPTFSLFGRIGGNTSMARVIDQVYTYNSANTASLNTGVDNKYKLRPGWQFGIGGDWNITDHISLSAEFDYSLTAYKRERNGIFGRDLLESTDQQNWISVPVYVKYSYNQGKIRPFGYIGYSVNLLLSDKLKVTYQNRDENPDVESGNVSTETYEGPSRDFSQFRKRANRSIVLGGGAKLKDGLNYWFVDLRYSIGLTNIINEDNIFTNPEIYRSGHVDDFLRLDNLSLSFGYVYPLYNPRKLKKARTKGILKGIKKQDR